MGHEEGEEQDAAMRGEEHKEKDCFDPKHHCHCEITDICFGREAVNETNELMNLHYYYKDVHRCNKCLVAMGEDEDKGFMEAEASVYK